MNEIFATWVLPTLQHFHPSRFRISGVTKGGIDLPSYRGSDPRAELTLKLDRDTGWIVTMTVPSDGLEQDKDFEVIAEDYLDEIRATNSGIRRVGEHTSPYAEKTEAYCVIVRTHLAQREFIEAMNDEHQPWDLVQVDSVDESEEGLGSPSEVVWQA